MSIIEPNINQLLDKTDHDAFLLCTLASKRSHEIVDMQRGQRDRALELQKAEEIAKASHRKPLSIAFDEIAKGDVSYDPSSLKYSDREY